MPRLILALIVVAACAPGSVGAPPGAVSVVRIVDGDSLILETVSGEVTLRLSGVNTPEQGECHHPEAAKALADLVDGARLSLTIEGVDRYGRTLGRLEADGNDVAVDMVRGGHGVAMAASPSRAELVAAEETAYDSKLGMWAADACGAGPLPLLGFAPDSSRTDPPGPDQDILGGEVVVVVNRGRRAVDLTGWVVRDGSSLHRYVFTPGTRIESGGVIAIDSADPGWTPGGSPVWSNQGDIAILIEPWGRVVARWRY